MLKYILRRTFYSIWVILGVLLLTFVLFNLAAGDPAAAVLGKNARPEEIENFRDELGSNLPLFYGYECRSAAVEGYEGDPAVSVTLKRNFHKERLFARIIYQHAPSQEFPLGDEEAAVTFQAPPADKITAVEIFQKQRSPWNTQFRRALGEIISFQSSYPCVRVFDFGRTLMTGEPIRDVLLQGMGPSLSLMLPIFFGELLGGIILALVAVAFRGRWPDRLLLFLSVAGISFSYLVAIIFGQWLFGYYLELFPVWGFGELRHYGLPVLIGILCGIGSNVRFFRTVFSDELRREYLRTAAAKGASPASVYGKHLLCNALIQIITKASAGLPFLFTGSLLLESFFGIPGLGFAGIEALRNSDVQLLKALVVLSAFLFVVMNLLADLAYAWADPRIKLE